MENERLWPNPESVCVCVVCGVRVCDVCVCVCVCVCVVLNFHDMAVEFPNKTA